MTARFVQECQPVILAMLAAANETSLHEAVETGRRRP
jgi:hypothetical protein